MKTAEQLLRENMEANLGNAITEHDWQTMLMTNITVKSALEMAAQYKSQKREPKKKQKIRLISFQLTMPNVGSWNGQWTGASKKYYVIRKVRDCSLFLKEGQTQNSFHYSWNDGWGANVSVEVVDAKEAAIRRKISSGFCNYDWMINNIIDHGSPKNKEELIPAG